MEHQGFDALQKGICRVFEIRTGMELKMGRHDGGWFKMHRSFFDSWIFDDGDYTRIWLWLIGRANHKPSTVLWKGEKRRMAEEQTIQFGPYRLDPANARLWCETQPLRLTPKAFQVLCCLVPGPGS